MSVARLVVDLVANTDAFKRDMQSAAQTMDRVGRDMQRMGGRLTTRVTLPLAAIGAAAVKMSVDAEESANKFNVVMGDAADDVRRRFIDLQHTIPMTLTEMERMAAGVQDFLVPLGFARDEAAGMSADMVELAADLASFNNVAADIPLQAIQSALAGMSRPLRQFGVDVSETRLQTLALNEGLIAQGQAMDSNARAQAIMIAVQRDSADAMGDAARTAESTANQLRFLRRDVAELAQGIGDVLVPAVTPLVVGLRGLVGTLRELDPATLRWAVGIGAAAAAMGPLLLAVGTLVRLLPLAASGFAALTSPIAIVIAGLASLAFTTHTVVNNWKELQVQAALAWARVAEVVGEAVIRIASWLERIPGMGSRFRELRERVEVELAALLAATGDRVAGLEREIADGFDGGVDAASELADEIRRAGEEAVAAAEAAMSANDQAAESTSRWAREMEVLAQRSEEVRRAQAEARVTPSQEIARASRATRDWALGYERIETLSSSVARLTREQREALLDVKDAAEESAHTFEDQWLSALSVVGASIGGLASQISNVAGAFATGGPVMGIAAGVGAMIGMTGRGEEVERARQEFERILDRFVDGLVDRSRWEQMRVAVERQASEAMQAFVESVAVQIPGFVRRALEQDFGISFAELGTMGIEEFMAFLDEADQMLQDIFGPQAREILTAYQGHLAQIEEQRQQDIASMNRDLSIRKLVAQGRDHEADHMRLQAQYQNELQQAMELGDDALVQLIHEVYELERAVLDAAQAAREAQDAFRAEQARHNLELRLLVAQGRDAEAIAMRQHIELQQAINDGRDAEYLSMLQVVHAAERQRAAQQNVTRSMRETERAMTGVTRALNAPRGFRMSLLEWSASASAAPNMFGAQSSTPQFSAPQRSQPRAQPQTSAPQQTINVRIETGAIQVRSATRADAPRIAEAVLKEIRKLERSGGDPLLSPGR